LNDLTKSRVDLVCDVAERWLDGAGPERQALVKHALRYAIKRGHPRALGLLGYGGEPRVELGDIAFVPRRVKIGQKTRISFSVRGLAKRQTLTVDLVVHFVKTRGKTSPKVFKVATLELERGARSSVAKTISLAVHTTRKPNGGRHVVEALINGRRFELGAFVVVAR
jgi:hypothetical protein